jgi:hypothetical protein
MAQLGVGLSVAVWPVGDLLAFDRVEEGFHKCFSVVSAPICEIALEKGNGLFSYQGRTQSATQRCGPRGDASKLRDQAAGRMPQCLE